MEDLLEVRRALAFPQNIVILSHRNPDGDAIGSCLAWMLYLSGRGHKVNVILPSEYPLNFSWMSRADEIIIFDTHAERAKELVDVASMIFCLDFNALDRIDKMGEWVRLSKATKVMVDHHIDPEPFSDLMISDPSASATCELIFDMISELGHEAFITPDIAECLYTGILTDTGNFAHALSPKLMRKAARLLELGVDNDRLQVLLFKNAPEKQLRLLGYCLYHRMEILPEYLTGYIYLTKEDYAKFSISRGDTEGIVNYLLTLKDVMIAALITDQNGIIKFSFRSKGDISVQSMSREHFNGGGHKNASGGYQHTSLKEAIEKFKLVIPKYADFKPLINSN
ncbi:MAG: DHH family phosphoesterase [Saprospiraceae bacterium]|jgi:phosphoesterase RecJ-like protein|nr:DHH family phosphoesterase [Saprospiraceae bacterium]MBK7371009.1 DHH family phosphoesterase [Saprospiraceae bacterium]MBK7436490.1 DHH family phosphoesterase [Saprospiraceae bacterium]MBK8281080.1 DHH family phosphoesterase [Saprospiraceae bacterium]MBK8514618.1 DHH family phosphoesterase [Saprospiraceae bacterium]